MKCRNYFIPNDVRFSLFFRRALCHLTKLVPSNSSYRDNSPIRFGIFFFMKSHIFQITDFGLSKVMEGSMGHDDDIELTSQFAGTYWYFVKKGTLQIGEFSGTCPRKRSS